MAYAIGLMSGTSLDGCDAALIRIDGNKISPVAFISSPMSKALRGKILDCCSLEKSNVRLLCSVNVEIGYWFAQAAKAVLEKAGIAAGDVECIGSHGQTVYHIAENEEPYMASTLQIGEPAIIAYETGIPVVSNLRAMDMAAGGRGAPLVPYAEYLLYRADHPRALQNLGGIGNVTALGANCGLDEVFAFDTGPANMIINALAKRFYGTDYDDGGAIAATGAVNEALLAEWMAIPYVSAPPPKATGRELYGAQFVEAALAAHTGIRPQDWLATATAYTAATIELNYRRFVFPRCPAKEIIASGGGAHNKTLLREIARRLPECTVRTQEDLGWDSDAKEALAFAVLAHETMHGRPSNVPGATGARHPVVLGCITPAPTNGPRN
jgi:anhydro-N-acetylmuramic acid kinase